MVAVATIQEDFRNRVADGHESSEYMRRLREALDAIGDVMVGSRPATLSDLCEHLRLVCDECDEYEYAPATWQREEWGAPC